MAQEQSGLQYRDQSVLQPAGTGRWVVPKARNYPLPLCPDRTQGWNPGEPVQQDIITVQDPCVTPDAIPSPVNLYSHGRITVPVEGGSVAPEQVAGMAVVSMPQLLVLSEGFTPRVTQYCPETPAGKPRKARNTPLVPCPKSTGSTGHMVKAAQKQVKRSAFVEQEIPLSLVPQVMARMIRQVGEKVYAISVVRSADLDYTIRVRMFRPKKKAKSRIVPATKDVPVQG